MRRIAVIGTGGTGKTTLALELGRRLGCRSCTSELDQTAAGR